MEKQPNKEIFTAGKSDQDILLEYLTEVDNGKKEYNQDYVDYLDGKTPDPRD